MCETWPWPGNPNELGTGAGKGGGGGSCHESVGGQGNRGATDDGESVEAPKFMEMRPQQHCSFGRHTASRADGGLKRTGTYLAEVHHAGLFLTA